ncbi:nitric oxide associated protein 1 [Halocaridina rubra]|uniref:Nitric oxide associated protein 1 n=1 Tax=Halocaridina rubra TaxID=373956 RepID=A0AAN9A312_HALRR
MEELTIEGSDDESLGLGSCDQEIPISNIPCGGCGARLHCQEHSLPGFLPKEIYSRLDIGGLKSSVCQRCYLLKHHNVALHVRVSPDIYPKLLEPIKREKALVVVVIDLLDMPCSIWPDLIDIFSPFLSVPYLITQQTFRPQVLIDAIHPPTLWSPSPSPTLFIHFHHPPPNILFIPPNNMTIPS